MRTRTTTLTATATAFRSRSTSASSRSARSLPRDFFLFPRIGRLIGTFALGRPWTLGRLLPGAPVTSAREPVSYVIAGLFVPSFFAPRFRGALITHIASVVIRGLSVHIRLRLLCVA